MMLEELLKKSRSCRRFHEDRPVDSSTLRELVNLGRLSPSGSNMQALKYITSSDPAVNARIFPALGWAGYITDWPGPTEGERPSAYIIILGDTEISKGFGCDHGIAAQSIMLGAAEKNLGGCMIGSIDRNGLRKVLPLPDRYEILLVLALGHPKEKIVLEEIEPDGSVRYWRDAEQTHHVPKRSLSNVILASY